jgi:hypothetical protein
MAHVFLLSPAFCGGRRAKILLNPQSAAPLALKLREGSLTLGDAFAFMSGLYFRGKLAYARAFGRDAGATLVITPTRGLCPPDTRVSAEVLREFAAVDLSAGPDCYRTPLMRDLAALSARLEETSRAVLLGSVATGKYVDDLGAALGARLHFPIDFVGRGDMSRGGLLLRSAAAAVELEYAVLTPGVRPRGARPPRLQPIGGAAGRRRALAE